ncbi:FecR family protein [Aureispira anguillae]|uniref:FecR family protein n=1 Tax=Aureispira anguillae TaxID=2864201 RepID=A0A916DV99_9BACT|nr:FecR family protein [Aureispira anguillae]BDS12926.1 FecR family protein [Aureispira anguillae]
MEDIYTILPKYFNKQCTTEENALVKAWKKEHPAEFKEQQMIWSLSKDTDYIEFDAKASWAELQPQLTDNASPQTTKVVGMAVWKKMAVAAAILLVCVLGIRQFINPSIDNDQLFVEGLNKEFDSTVRGTEMTTQRAVKAMTLTNGDKVWLNKNTKIEDMGDQEGAYAVKIHKGEAFFDVKSRKKDKQEPFLVHTKNAAVSIIGTQFSVAHKKEKTIIRVVEGVVKVIASDINEISLKAGEQAFVIDGNIEKFDNFSPNYLAWKTGRFEFYKTPIDKVAILMQTFYDVKIEVAKGTQGQTTGNFNVMEVQPMLESLTLASGLKLEAIKPNLHYRISNE